MFFLNVYLLLSLVVFLQLTKEYIDPHSHLFVVICFVLLLVMVNHFSDHIEKFVSTVDQHQGQVWCILSFVNWIKRDYKKSKTKRAIECIIKYFLFTLQNTDGHKT